MKNSSPDNSFAEKSNLKNTLILIIIVILILLALFIITAYFIKKSVILTNKNINSNTRAIAATLHPEPTEVYSRGGTITAVQQNSITVQTRVRTNSFIPSSAYEIRNLSVLFNQNTVFTKKSITQFNQTGIIPTPEPAIRNDLRVGRSVNVKASINIKDLTAFTATAIEIIY